MALLGSSRLLSRAHRQNLFAIFTTNAQNLPDMFHVQYDDSAYSCAVPRRSFSSSSEKDKKDKKELAAGGGGADHLLAIARRGDVVRKLEEEKKSRVMISYGEYASICQSFGLNIEEATELASALHTTGTICQLTSESGKKIIYLRPEVLLTSLMDAVDPEGHLVEDKKNELKVLKSDLDSLEQLLGGLQKKARRNANLKMWGFFGYLTAQTAVLARLTWWEFSWDIMEPITYFITMSGTWFALLYTNITKEEYGHESFGTRLSRKKLESLMAKMGIAPDKHAVLVQRIKEIEADLKSHGYGKLIQEASLPPAPSSGPSGPSGPAVRVAPVAPAAPAAAGRPDERRLSYAELTSAVKNSK